MESYPIWIIIDDMETYINSSRTFENAQRRILYDITVENVYLIEDCDEFTELLKRICNYTKDSMPILDRTYSKSKIISIMTDNIFKAFGIEKIKGLKIQLDPNYDEKIVQFCKERTAYKFYDIITSKHKGISKYNFTDYKINKCISFILAEYADTMYKVSLFISYQYYLDPNTNFSTIENSKDRPRNHPFPCIKVLMEPKNENIHCHYELQNIFTDNLCVDKLKKVLLDDMNKHGKRIVNVHFPNLHILNCIEEHIKKLRGEERIITSDDIAETMRKSENLFDLREFYMTDVHNFGYVTSIFKNRQVTEFEKFFSVYKQEVTEDSFTKWQEYMISFNDKICGIDYFIYEQRIQDYFNSNRQN